MHTDPIRTPGQPRKFRAISSYFLLHHRGPFNQYGAAKGRVLNNNPAEYFNILKLNIAKIFTTVAINLIRLTYKVGILTLSRRVSYELSKSLV